MVTKHGALGVQAALASLRCGRHPQTKYDSTFYERDDLIGSTSDELRHTDIVRFETGPEGPELED